MMRVVPLLATLFAALLAAPLEAAPPAPATPAPGPPAPVHPVPAPPVQVTGERVLYVGKPQQWLRAQDTYRPGPVFTTAQEALEAARDGDTILVLDEVTGPVVVDKSVALLGYGNRKRPQVRDTVTITADDVWLDRLHFAVDAAPTLVVRGAARPRVTGCFFIESPGGLSIEQSTGGVFEDNQLLFGGGLRVIGGGGHTFRNNQVDSGDIYAVRVEGSPGNRFLGNHVRRAGWTGLLLFSRSSGTLLEGNVFQGADVGLSIQTDDNVVRRNHFQECLRGLALTRSPFGKDPAELDRVSYLDSPDGGTALDIHGNTIEGNTFRDCAREAVLLKEARRNRLAGNRVDGTGLRAFVLMGGSDDNELLGNEVLGGQRPLLVTESTGNRVEELLLAGPELAAAAPTPLARRLAPDGSGRQLLFGDFHTHSLLSDGASTPEELFAYARDVAGLDFTALSDHGEYVARDLSRWAALEAAAEAATRDDFLALPGYETTFRIGWSAHYNVYFTGPGGTPYMAPHGGRAWIPRVETLTPKRLLERLEDDGVETLVIRHHYWATPRYWAESPLESDMLPLIEVASVHAVWSGDRRVDSYSSDRDGEIRGHVSTMNGALDSGRVVGVCGSSDSHYAFPGDGGLTGVLADGRDAQSLFEALRARRCFATTGAPIALGFTADGQPMGSVLEAGTHAAGEAVVEGTAPLAEVAVYQGERVVARAELDGVQTEARLTWAAQPPLPPGSWLQLRVLQVDGQMAWSSPVWVGERRPDVAPEGTLDDRERMVLLAYAAVLRAWADLPTKDLANRSPRQALQDPALARRVRELWPRYVEAAAEIEEAAERLGLTTSEEAQRVLDAWSTRFGQLPAPIRVRPRVKPMVDVERVRQELGLD